MFDSTGAAAVSKPKPFGEWNDARSIQTKGRLAFYFNATKTPDVQQGSGEWKKMIENSKFKSREDFATSPKGTIAFQDHGYEVAFRNVKSRQL